MMTPEEARDMLHYESEDGFTAPELCLTAELAARAPGMAEQIANMRYEYAAQVEETPGVWRYLHRSGASVSSPTAACWCKTFEAAPTVLALYLHRETTPSRIVRRLVSPVEVVE